MLTVSHLSYQYGSGSAGIKDINLEINPGELVAVLGMNGSGKTTLGRVLGGLLLAQSGQILIAGQPFSNGKVLGQVGYLFSPVARQFIGHTVEEDILFGLESRGLTRAEIGGRLEQALRDFDLKALRHRTLETLSQGEQQRAALAAVLVLNPDYLVLDEPTAPLDLDSSRGLYQQLMVLRAQGIGVIVLTNQVEEACRAERIYLLANGSILTEGTPWEVANNPATEAYGFSHSIILQIVRMLASRGIDLEPALHTEGLVEAIWRWKSSK